MIRILLTFVTAILFAGPVMAQPGKSNEQQELEKERQRLKKEIDQTQQLLNQTKKSTKENLGNLALINRKLNLQENVINTINKDINLLDNTITKSQRDVRKLSLLLDTLKQEYAKSMVYSYKNRNNADFLNFIFSATSFNDAIRRITYLKSYRSYREMQGENILRTQALLRDRIDELSGNKQKKSVVLQTQSKEIEVLANQQKEKNEVVQKLKEQGKELNNQIAAKKKQMTKVSAAITAAIKKVQEEARKEALAKAEAERAERAKQAAANPAATTKTSSTKTSKAKTETAKQQESSILNSSNMAINASFEKNKRGLPWPVDRGYVLMHFGENVLPNGTKMNISCTSIGADIGTPVKAIFDGEVIAVRNADDIQIVIIQHGKYFSTYSNLGNVGLQKGQKVVTGQVLGKVLPNDEGIGVIDIYISNEKSELNPESWLRPR